MIDFFLILHQFFSQECFSSFIATSSSTSIYSVIIIQLVYSYRLLLSILSPLLSWIVLDMWESLKLCISYGFRGEYGVGYEMYQTIGNIIAIYNHPQHSILLPLPLPLVPMSFLKHLLYITQATEQCWTLFSTSW